MHNDFADWCRTTTFNHDRDTLQCRWKGVETALEKFSVDMAMELVRIVYKWPVKPSELLDTFRQYFKDTDPAFLTTGNDKEVQVLAGCVLAILCVDDKQAMTEVALALLTASTCGTLNQDTGIDLIGMARQRILLDGANTRRRPTSKDFVNYTIKKPIDAAITTLTATQDIPTTVATLKTFGAEINKLATSIQNEFKQQIETLTKTITIQDEELQSLWWVVGQRSNLWNAKFNDIEPTSRPVLLGYEYSTLTNFVEPPSLQAILAQIGVLETEVTIPEAINSCGVDKLEMLLIDGICPIIFPIHDAIRRAHITGADNSWIPMWSKVTGIAAESKFSSHSVAIQFYREHKLYELITT